MGQVPPEEVVLVVLAVVPRTGTSPVALVVDVDVAVVVSVVDVGQDPTRQL